jgi:hypothetical protein
MAKIIMLITMIIVSLIKIMSLMILVMMIITEKVLLALKVSAVSVKE